VKKVFIRSGIRFDYLMADKDDTFMEELCEHHVSGQLKVAPEHISDSVLKLMGKPENAVYEKFQTRYKKINEELGKKQYIVPYLISSHPGSTLKEAVELAEYLRDLGYMPEQVQDFYPTPSTISTCMYYTGLDPRTMEEVYVPKSPHEKAMQRALIQYRNPKNYDLVVEALKKADRMDLIGFDKKCLVRPRQFAKEKQWVAKENNKEKGRVSNSSRSEYGSKTRSKPTRDTTFHSNAPQDKLPNRKKSQGNSEQSSTSQGRMIQGKITSGKVTSGKVTSDKIASNKATSDKVTGKAVQKKEFHHNTHQNQHSGNIQEKNKPRQNNASKPNHTEKGGAQNKKGGFPGQKKK
jgi:hypothetical protein